MEYVEDDNGGDDTSQYDQLDCAGKFRCHYGDDFTTYLHRVKGKVTLAS